MNIQKFHFLLEKYDSGEISNDELEKLNYLTESDPVLKQEFEDHVLAIIGIKSQALRNELTEVIYQEDQKKAKRKKLLWVVCITLLLILLFYYS